jgi:hypothetical protein
MPTAARLLLPILLIVLLITPAAAQSSGQRGMRVSQVQTAYLVEHAQTDMPAPANLGGEGATTRDVMAQMQAAQAKAGGSPVRMTLNGATPTEPTPRALFETWIEPESRDYAESVLTGFSGVESKAGRTVIRRFVRDNFRHVYVSYAMTVETLPEPGTFRAVWGDSDAARPTDLPASTEWKVVSPAQHPVSQIL